MAGALAAGLIMSQLKGGHSVTMAFRCVGHSKIICKAFIRLIEISAVIGFIAALGSYHFGSLAIHGVQLLNWVCSGECVCHRCAL